jgi:hypothetical protein
LSDILLTINFSIENELPKKRGRKSKEDQRKDNIINKLYDIAGQNITDIITIKKGGASDLQARFIHDMNGEDVPKNVSNCIKGVKYEIGGSGHMVSNLELHDPLDAIKLLIELGELK